MIRTLLATTAIAALLTAPVMAQSSTPATPAANDTTTSAPANADNMKPAANGTTKPAAASDTTASSDMMMSGYTLTTSDVMASAAIGAHVYSSAAKDANDIGTVKDLVLAQDGSVKAAIIGVGGFLGIGEKSVAVDFSALKWTKAADGSMRYVLPTTKDALTSAPDFKYPAPPSTANAPGAVVTNGAAPNAAAPGAPANTAAPAAPANTAAPAANTNGATTPAPAVNANAAPATNANMAPADQSKMTPMNPQNMKADDLKGVPVMGENNNEIGKVSDFVLTKDGKVDAVIVDVGGFLGIGSKPVAVAFDAANFMTDKNGQIYMVLNATKDQLNAQTAYDKNTYAANRDNMRMVVTK